MTPVNTQGIDQLLQELNTPVRARRGPARAGRRGRCARVRRSAARPRWSRSTTRSRTPSRLQREFDLNAPNVNLHEVMVSLQKASLSFQTMVQVRNRLVSAYQEIMNMQV